MVKIHQKVICCEDTEVASDNSGSLSEAIPFLWVIARICSLAPWSSSVGSKIHNKHPLFSAYSFVQIFTAFPGIMSSLFATFVKVVDKECLWSA